MKDNRQDNLESCVCGRKPKKSFFGKIDVAVGSLILSGLTIFALVKDFSYVIPYAGAFLVAYWLLLVIVRLLMKHSIPCSSRWAAMSIIGSLGGFGIFGF